MLKTLTCIICPIGCSLTVESRETNGQVRIEVSGYQCPKGKNYATEEMLTPKRTLQSSMVVVNGDLPLVSVKTSEAVAKDKLMAILSVINKTKVQAPVESGHVLIEDVLGLGVSIVATKNINKNC